MRSPTQRWNRFIEHVQSASAALPAETRKSIFGTAAGHEGTVPEDLGPFVDTVARHAYRVTDDQVAGLRAAGRSDDEIFEATVVAAAGAADRRLRAALRAMQGRR
ncbi:hypothetical protein KO481_29285 [Nocardia sp. NEAU-G5]|uniref:Uncharacterized protein n=1 Tax=Nocardia albiluteola TaxID=2842303 RepID=A0ABS6B8R9_9NOCA|nr:hypothetical protein [Nocardia albiluteola]MBU3062558.1 hypothetical protein [Nocardia albiluteola]MBU3065608.1 hypothetical protein [Nocardia albiluteola]